MRRAPLRPTTPLGTSAAWLALGYIVLMPAWRVLPGGALIAFACGLAGGVAALVAIRRRNERGLLAYAALVPLVFVVLFVVAELAIGHS